MTNALRTETQGQGNPGGYELDFGEFGPVLSAAGFPTFDQFRKNPDKWREAADEVLKAVDESTHAFRGLVVKQRYEAFGYPCDTLEQVERICRDEGVALRDLDMRPQIIPVVGGKCEIIIGFARRQNAGDLL